MWEFAVPIGATYQMWVALVKSKVNWLKMMMEVCEEEQVALVAAAHTEQDLVLDCCLYIHLQISL
jgi:hypothetical protein